MNIYIDESGSINNHLLNNNFFIIALVHATDLESLKRAYKRFISTNHDKLLQLDENKIHPRTGTIVKKRGKMFYNGSFRELKGSQFDKDMKQAFVEFFSRKPSFELYYIRIANHKLSNHMCESISHIFNYAIRLALEYFFRNHYLPNEDCSLQLDERNERSDSRHFLENYLNTELVMNGTSKGNFFVTYFDSADNDLVQVADVFANLYYSHLQTNGYGEQLKILKDAGILKCIFDFPLS